MAHYGSCTISIRTIVHQRYSIYSLPYGEIKKYLSRVLFVYSICHSHALILAQSFICGQNRANLQSIIIIITHAKGDHSISSNLRKVGLQRPPLPLQKCMPFPQKQLGLLRKNHTLE